MRIVRIDPAQSAPPEHPEWFPGSARMHFMHSPDTPVGIELIAVFFEPGSRTVPHVHAVDQVLQVVEGEGVLATEEERRIIRVGDWAVVPGGLWHWHGATETSSMCHVSIKQPGDTDWTVERKDFDTYMEGAR